MLTPPGPGDARPAALQIIKDQGLLDALPDKVFIVTGASSGIGTETARAFAATGARVFLPVRDLAKGEKACKAFLEPGRVELLEMDNDSLASVRTAAKAFLAKSDKLNVLVNNAGIMATPEGKTADGFESQFGTNHLAHFLFFNLLKETMIKSATPSFNSRVVNVSSMGHLSGGVQFDNYGFEDGSYTPWGSYGQAKTANIYMANHITTLYGDKGINGFSLHPGGIWTGLQKFVDEATMKKWKEIPGKFSTGCISGILTDKMYLGVEKFMKSPEQGAATTVLAAVGKEFEGKGRLYLEDCAVAGPTTDNMSGTFP
jgi:NAD(P)-dependent dehydrogenase (short-subunit alcohol dehydrogenase family)